MNETNQKELNKLCLIVRDNPLLREILEYLSSNKGPQKYSKMANELISQGKIQKSKANIYAKRKILLKFKLIKEPEIYNTIYVEITEIGKDVLDFSKQEGYFS